MINALNLAGFVTIASMVLVMAPFMYLGIMFAKDYRSDKQIRMIRAFKNEINRYKNTKELVPGQFRLLEFCIEAEVDAKVGKRFLQKQVKEFAGIVDVDQFGDVVYFFGDAKGKFLESDEE